MRFNEVRRGEVFGCTGVVLGDHAEASIIAGAPQRPHDRRGDAE